MGLVCGVMEYMGRPPHAHPPGPLLTTTNIPPPSRTGGAQSPEPRAQSPEPRAQSPEPRAQSTEPRAQSPEPRAQSNVDPSTWNEGTKERRNEGTKERRDEGTKGRRDEGMLKRKQLFYVKRFILDSASCMD